MIGSRFDADLLAGVVDSAQLAPLIEADLVDQVMVGQRAEYTFRHPLIRAVAYESQLKSDRAELHRRLAAVIEQRGPGSADENAALIAEHLEAAGDLAAAYAWHMRAGSWLMGRDVVAARLSWQRARRVADALPSQRDQACAFPPAYDRALAEHTAEIAAIAGNPRAPSFDNMVAGAGKKRPAADAGGRRVLQSCLLRHQ